MGTAFLYGNSGGSVGTGATLTVTAPSGCTVTISKDGKTKTKTAGTDGVAVFRGLTTGQWTVTITDGDQTAQKTVTITADYSTAITFFSATIHVTYPAGSTCTATDGVTTLTAPDTSGTWDCVVPNAGTWTVSCTDGTKTKSITVHISTDGEAKSVTLGYTEYLVKSGVIDMTAHPHSATDDKKAVNSYEYNGHKSLRLEMANGRVIEHVFSNVAVPDWANTMKIHYYLLPSYQYDPVFGIGVASVSIIRSSDQAINEGTSQIDVTGIAGTTVAFKVRAKGRSGYNYCYIGNAWFE